MEEKNSPIFKNDMTIEEQAEQDCAFEQAGEDNKKAALAVDIADLAGSALELLGQ